MDGELTLRIVLAAPPKDVVFGLQRGRGSAYETLQKQKSGDKNLEFEFTAEVAGRKSSRPVRAVRAGSAGPALHLY